MKLKKHCSRRNCVVTHPSSDEIESCNAPSSLSIQDISLSKERNPHLIPAVTRHPPCMSPTQIRLFSDTMPVYSMPSQDASFMFDKNISQIAKPVCHVRATYHYCMSKTCKNNMSAFLARTTLLVRLH